MGFTNIYEKFQELINDNPITYTNYKWFVYLDNKRRKNIYFNLIHAFTSAHVLAHVDIGKPVIIEANVGLKGPTPTQQLYV